jgi:aminoglycoside phosphotransferase (APT) family kinase protein
VEELVSTEAQELGRRIIEINRKFRLGDTTPAEWTTRIEVLLRAQPDLRPPLRVSNVRPLQGGAGSSSGTLFFEAEISGEAPQEYVLRFEPIQKLFHVYDLDGQVRIQRALADTDVPVPAQCWEDIKGHHLTVPGYIMERAAGEAAPAAWFSEGLIAEAEPARRRTLVLSFVETLARVHAVDWRLKGLSFLLDRAEGPGLLGREINWYWDALTWAGETAALARLGGVHEWLLANQPNYAAAVLCHGDANFTNNLFSGDEVTAVLDWEMAFIGTPECDLTYALMGMSSLSTDFPDGVPTPEEMLVEYERVSGRTLRDLPYYTVFCHYRLAVILNLGMRAFPPDFQVTFQAYIDGSEAKLFEHARSAGAW